MNKARRKLILSGLSLLMALVILATASLAWYTISTNPEIKNLSVTMFSDHALLLSIDNEHYSRSIDITELFADYISELRPVSTVDGEHWFIPAYDDEGNLLDASEFTMDTELKYANICKYKTDKNGKIMLDDNDEPILLAGEELNDARSQAYYIYADIWVKSENKNGAHVYLSIPRNLSQSQDDEELNNTYGTYVMPYYRLDVDDENPDDKSISSIGYACQSALRVGFLVYGATDDEEEETETETETETTVEEDGEEKEKPTRFVIYEPNANVRSGNKPLDEDGKYVVDYIYSADEYTIDNYIKTYPIGYNEEGHAKYIYEGKTIPTLYIFDTSTNTYEVTNTYDLNASKNGDVQYYTRKYSNEKNFLPQLYIKDIVPEGAEQTYTAVTNYVFGSEKTTTYYYLDTEELTTTIVTEIDSSETEIETTIETEVYKPYVFSDRVYYIYKNKVYNLAEGETYNSNVTYYYREYPTWVYDGEDIPDLFIRGAYDKTTEDYTYTKATTYNFKTETYYKEGAVGKVVEIPEDTLIAQQASTWNLERLQEELEKDNPVIDSSCIQALGQFYNSDEILASEDRAIASASLTTGISGDTLILNLPDDQPVRIRIFIWVEGQDVDCWNDIADGTFFMNLELTGEENLKSDSES